MREREREREREKLGIIGGQTRMRFPNTNSEFWIGREREREEMRSQTRLFFLFLTFAVTSVIGGISPSRSISPS